MSIGLSSLRNGLYTVIKSLAGAMPVVWMNQNSPRPAKPYISLFLSGIQRAGEDSYSLVDALTGNMTVTGNREFDLSVNIYGTGANALLCDLVDNIHKISVLEALRVYGIALVDVGTVNDLSEVLDSRFEERAVVDLRMRVGSSVSEVVDRIETVAITHKIIDEGLDVITLNPNTLTITVAPPI